MNFGMNGHSNGLGLDVWGAITTGVTKAAPDIAKQVSLKLPSISLPSINVPQPVQDVAKSVYSEFQSQYRATQTQPDQPGPGAPTGSDWWTTEVNAAGFQIQPWMLLGGAVLVGVVLWSMSDG